MSSLKRIPEQNGIVWNCYIKRDEKIYSDCSGRTVTSFLLRKPIGEKCRRTDRILHICDYEFRNVCGGLKLQLYGDYAVREIEVSGNNVELLAGPAYIFAYTDGRTPQISMHSDASRTVVLDCGEKGVRLNKNEDTDFIITLPPVDFSKGFNVQVRDVSGR